MLQDWEPLFGMYHHPFRHHGSTNRQFAFLLFDIKGTGSGYPIPIHQGGLSLRSSRRLDVSAPEGRQVSPENALVMAVQLFHLVTSPVSGSPRCGPLRERTTPMFRRSPQRTPKALQKYDMPVPNRGTSERKMSKSILFSFPDARLTTPDGVVHSLSIRYFTYLSIMVDDTSSGWMK